MEIVWIALGAALLQGKAVLGQISAPSCSSGTWMNNDEGQSPCLVAGYLEGVCNNGEWTVPPLPDLSQVYVGPTTPSKSNECICSTVVYNLLSACGACQGGEWATWSRWATNCSSADVSRGSYPEPIPQGITVPVWAYIDTSVEGSWNEPEANTAEGSHIPDVSATVTSTSTTATTASGISTSASPTPTSSGGSSGSTPVGAIAGGVVGGVAVLVIAGLIIFFCLRRRSASSRSRTTPAPLPPTSYAPGSASAYSPGMEKSSFLPPSPHMPYTPDLHGGGQNAAIAAATGTGTSSSSPPATNINRFTLYDPANPATWPGSPDAIYPSATPAPTYYSAAGSPGPHGPHSPPIAEV